ncbi:MAG: TetR/AcrR family transcriptional regulator [Alphaproteobacteria bacterium]
MMNTLAVAGTAGNTAAGGGEPADADESAETQETLESAVLARLEPAGVSGGGSWQQRKSARTRIAILEAAIRCLAEKGYANTTTKTVASMAEVSRGAMLHHYPTKKALIEQAIAWTFFKRMERNFREFRSLSEAERRNEMAGVTLYWKNVNTLEYRASLELCMAARCDDELRGILEPKAAEFEEVLLAELPRVFPEWADIPEQLTLANDLVIAALDGLLINQIKWGDTDRAEKVRKLVGRVVLLLSMEKIRAGDL